MNAGQMGNGSVSPFTNTSTEKTISTAQRMATSFHLNSWPPHAAMKTSATVASTSPSGFIR
jgi:hypothetical protein